MCVGREGKLHTRARHASPRLASSGGAKGCGRTTPALFPLSQRDTWLVVTAAPAKYVRCDQICCFNMAGFAESLRPEKFTGVNFKRWKSKVRIWFNDMSIWDTRLGKLTAEAQEKFDGANNLFVGCIISNISDGLVDVYIDMTDAKVLWDALVARYDAADACNELYLMESFHDYRMVNNRSVVEQTHEVQCIVKNLKLLKYQLPDKFVAGCIIAKLPSS